MTQSIYYFRGSFRRCDISSLVKALSLTPTPPGNDFLTKKKISCEIISGKVSVNKRTEIIKEFQEKETPQVLIIQPQAASHGLTLTAANTIIWYAPVTSVETYLQANARINRPGQHNPMTIVHIQGSEVEAKLYGMLQNNITNHSKIIDLYRNELNLNS